MNDERKTKKQLAGELAELRRRVAELEVFKAKWMRAESLLQKGDERLSALAQNLFDLITVHDADGVILRESPSAARILGYPPGALIGKNPFEWIHPEDRAAVQTAFAEVTRHSNRGVPVEFRFRRADGMWIHLESIGSNLCDDPWIQGIVLTTRDITERKQAESRMAATLEALRESEQKFRGFVEQSSYGIMLLNEQGVVVEWNRMNEQITGLKRERVLGRQLVDAQPGLSSDEREPDVLAERIKAALLDALRAGAAFSMGEPLEIVYHRPDGMQRVVQHTVFPIETDKGLLIGVTSRDVTDRRRADEALQAAEQKLRDIIESSTNVFYSHTPDHLLTYVSPQSEAFFDIEPEEAMVRWTDFLTDNPVNALGVQATQRAIDTGQPQPPYELELVGKKGRVVWVEVHEAPIVKDGKTTAIVGSLTDITWRKQIEDALRESEHKFRTFIEQSSEGLALVDEQGYVIEWNQSQEKITGLGRSQVIGALFWDVIFRMLPPERRSPELHERFQSAMREALRVGQSPYFSEHSAQVIRTPGGEERFIQQAAFPIQTDKGYRIGSVTRDVTESRRVEEEIRRLNQDLVRRTKGLAALNKAGQLLTSTLDLNTLLGRVMEQVRNLLDAEAASVLLCTPTEDGADIELVFAAATDPGADKLVGTRLPLTAGIAGWAIRERLPALVTDAQSDTRFYHRVDKTTGMMTRSLMAVPLISKGSVLGVVEAVNKGDGAFDEHDLKVLEALASSAAIAIENARLYATEQERAAALAHALEQQRELDRLQREFIQNVSHELRTPLSLIRGHAEMFEAGWLGDLSPRQQESLNIIAQRTRMLTKLVDDITAILEVEARPLAQEEVDLMLLARMSLADFQVAAQKAGLALDGEIAPDVPPVRGDPISLRRVLDNLLGNACKFTPPGGRIVVRLCQKEGRVTLQVADNGIGISESQLGRIFERFYQVDGSETRRYSGMGLGLALVKDIVEAHGGQVAAASKVGDGTTFTVVLPAMAHV